MGWEEVSWAHVTQPIRRPRLSSVWNYYLPWKHLTLAASTVRRWQLTACVLTCTESAFWDLYSRLVTLDILKEITTKTSQAEQRRTWSNTFILYSRHISFSLPPPTSVSAFLAGLKSWDPNCSWTHNLFSKSLMQKWGKFQHSAKDQGHSAMQQFSCLLSTTYKLAISFEHFCFCTLIHSYLGWFPTVLQVCHTLHLSTQSSGTCVYILILVFALSLYDMFYTPGLCQTKDLWNVNKF
jgi:hypothetical protein